MKIIHVVDSSIQHFDGVATYINELILASEKLGDQILLLCTPPIAKSNLRQINYKAVVKVYRTVRCPGKPKLIYSFKGGMETTIHNFNPSFIWIHSIGTIGTKAAKIAKGKYPVVYTKHCFDGELWSLYLNAPKQFNRFIYALANKLERNVADSCAFFVYHIQDTKKIESTSYYNKFVKFNPPIQSRYFENRTEKLLEARKLTLGFCGRCEFDKGLDDTFAGLKLFKEKHPHIELIFYLIGDGPLASSLQLKYDFLKIIVTGYVTDVIPYLDRLDGYILSSKHETISLASLEAYSRGIPIFSRPIGYLSEIKHLDNFYLFNNHHELVDSLDSLFLRQKRSRFITHDIKLDTLTISYDKLLHDVAQKVTSAYECDAAIL